MLLVARFFGGMGGKDKPLFYIVKVIAELVIEIKRGRHPMRFVEVVTIGIETDQVDQFGATNAE